MDVSGIVIEPSVTTVVRATVVAVASLVSVARFTSTDTENARKGKATNFGRVAKFVARLAMHRFEVFETVDAVEAFRTFGIFEVAGTLGRTFRFLQISFGLAFQVGRFLVRTIVCVVVGTFARHAIRSNMFATKFVVNIGGIIFELTATHRACATVIATVGTVCVTVAIPLLFANDAWFSVSTVFDNMSVRATLRAVLNTAI